MKKTLTILLTLAILFTFFAPYAAAVGNAPAVSFSKNGQEVYGGTTATVTVKTGSPVESDLSVSFSDQDQTYSVVIKAGESSASVDIPTELTSEKKQVFFRFEKSDAYTSGEKPTHFIDICPIPVFSIYQELIVPDAGEDTYVAVECKSPRSRIVKPVPMSIRADDGSVIHEFEYEPRKLSRYIHFTAPTDYDPQGSFHLYNEITDEKLDSVGVALVHSDSRMVRTVEKPGQIAVSFDCAYGAQHIDFILDTLDKYDAKATFFMTGFFVRENPDAVKKIAERGHELGNHTNDHPNLTTLTPELAYNQLNRCNEEIIEASGGVVPTIFRPPYGACDPTVYAIAAYCGLDVVRWSVETVDYDIEYDYKQAIRNVTEGIGAGEIILFHASATHTERTLDACFQDYLDKGLEIVTVSELLIDDHYIVNEDGHQIPDPDYSYVTAEDLIGDVKFDVPADILGAVSADALTAVWGNESVLCHADDIEAIKNDSSLFDITYLPAETAPASAGDKVCTAVLSYNGEEWFTAELTASEIAPENTSAPDEPATPDDDSDEFSYEDEKSGGISCASLGSIAIISSAVFLIIAAVVTILVSSKKQL